jgi:hypothetical protein
VGGASVLRSEIFQESCEGDQLASMTDEMGRAEGGSELRQNESKAVYLEKKCFLRRLSAFN